mmetsp:Transcript_15564/g.42408  ORF Transcript_15564/g.42408 Transcript_15564/m.42408 type:complete len:443 (-) Transcript_15564:2250-3578(-)
MELSVHGFPGRQRDGEAPHLVGGVDAGHRLGVLLPVVGEGPDTLVQVLHHLAEIVAGMHVGLADLRDEPASLHLPVSRASFEDLVDLDGRHVGELQADWPLDKLDDVALPVVDALFELHGQRPEGEVLRVVDNLVIDLVEIGILIQRLFTDEHELPARFHPELHLRIAVDGEARRDDGCREVVLDAKRPVPGVDGPDGAIVIEVQAQALRLRLGLRHHDRLRRRRLGLGRGLDRRHGLVDWCRLLHDLEEAGEAAAQRHHGAKQEEPPRRAHVDGGDGGAQRLVAETLAWLQGQQLGHRAGPGRGDVDGGAAQKPPRAAAGGLRHPVPDHSNGVAAVHSVPHLHCVVVEDDVHAGSLGADDAVKRIRLQRRELADGQNVVVLGDVRDDVSRTEVLLPLGDLARPRGLDHLCLAIVFLQDGYGVALRDDIPDMRLPLIEVQAA